MKKGIESFISIYLKVLTYSEKKGILYRLKIHSPPPDQSHHERKKEGKKEGREEGREGGREGNV